jgi:hypothetical protein
VRSNGATRGPTLGSSASIEKDDHAPKPPDEDRALEGVSHFGLSFGVPGADPGGGNQRSTLTSWP